MNEMYENEWKSKKMNENEWTWMKINENEINWNKIDEAMHEPEREAVRWASLWQGPGLSPLGPRGPWEQRNTQCRAPGP